MITESLIFLTFEAYTHMNMLPWSRGKKLWGKLLKQYTRPHFSEGTVCHCTFRSLIAGTLSSRSPGTRYSNSPSFWTGTGRMIWKWCRIFNMLVCCFFGMEYSLAKCSSSVLAATSPFTRLSNCRIWEASPYKSCTSRYAVYPPVDRHLTERN